jgi:GNAT superfamily N-acetyltransferase
MGYVSDNTEVARITKLLTKQMVSGFEITFDPNPFKIVFNYRCGGQNIAGFTLIEQYHCCGILVSSATYVDKDHQKQGIAQEMMPLKEALAKEFGYSLLMATVNMTGNPAEVHILEKFNWKKNSEFVNARTKNTVGIFTKEIK